MSLLERLYDDPIYKKGLGIACRVELNENRRSHKDVSTIYIRTYIRASMFYVNTFVLFIRFWRFHPNCSTLDH